MTLKNNSTDNVACFIANGLELSHPDTLLPKTRPIYHITEHITDSAIVLSGSGYNFSVFFEILQDEYLSVYVFNQEEIDSLGWEEISYRNQYLVRYDLTEKDLMSLRGKLSYPPSEAMRNVKMWPRYEDVRP